MAAMETPGEAMREKLDGVVARTVQLYGSLAQDLLANPKERVRPRTQRGGGDFQLHWPVSMFRRLSLAQARQGERHSEAPTSTMVVLALPIVQEL